MKILMIFDFCSRLHLGITVASAEGASEKFKVFYRKQHMTAPIPADAHVHITL